MIKVLITGGAGFVGFHLADKLSRDGGHEVTIVDNFERPNKDSEFNELISRKNVHYVNLDLSLESSYDKLPSEYYDEIYHLAALNGTSNFYDFPARVLKVGTYSTINLLDWVAKQKKRPLILYTSSSEAYAGTSTILEKDFPFPTPEDIPLAIDDVSNVRWSYGASKLIGEVAFYSYRKSHGIDNFKIARLHNAYGPRMGHDHVISQFIKRFLSGRRPFEIFGGSNTRSFCHIDDVLDGFEQIRKNGAKGEIYHIGNDDEEISIEDVAKLIFDINEEEYDFLVHDAPEGSANRRCPNIDKIKSLGHKKRVSLKDGVRKTFEWYKMKELKQEIFDKVEQFFKEKQKVDQNKVTVGYPCFDHKEVNQALDSLLDVWISQGPKVKRFEREYSDYVGVKYGIACNSGSSANLLALTALIQTGKLSPGDEVIVPSATFTTVISPILQVGLKPVFVDVELDSYNIDPAAIARAITDKTKLIMVVHSLGCPADMDSIMAISRETDIPVFEDCCEAHGSFYKGRMVGSFGLISTWSFFVAHNMTTGEGGMITTSSNELKDALESVREFGRLKKYEPDMPRFYYSDEHLNDYDERYVFTNIGYNLRMTDVAASLGIEQLKKLETLNRVRNDTANTYTNGLEKYKKYLKLPGGSPDRYHSFYGYPILIEDSAPFTRKEIVNHLEEKGIETRAFMGGDLSIQPAYRNTGCRVAEEMPNTDKMRDNAFFIGCHPYVTDEQKSKVVEAFNSFMKKYV